MNDFEQAARLTQAARLLSAAKNVVVFTGAGVSAESGIPTFRDGGGLWQRFPPQQFANWKGLIRTALRRPRQLANFVHEVLQPIATATPNAAHQAIERLEEHTRVTVVTQNIDNLHQDAGSTTVHTVHGTLFEVVYADGRFLRLISRRELAVLAARLAKLRQAWVLPLARLVWALRPLLGITRGKLYRPNLVLFGDAMCEPDWSQAVAAVKACDCLLQVGCSGQVFPAAILTLTAHENGAAVIAIDLEDTTSDLWLPGTAGNILPQLLQAAFDTDEPLGER